MVYLCFPRADALHPGVSPSFGGDIWGFHDSLVHGQRGVPRRPIHQGEQPGFVQVLPADRPIGYFLTDSRDKHTADRNTLGPRLAAVVPLGDVDPGSGWGRLHMDSRQASARGNHRYLYRVGVAWVSSRCSLLPGSWVAGDELGVSR